MTREELMKMSKKELKDRLKDLGKNAQALSGQELTDAMDEARTIGEILDEIKAREDLMAAAQAAGGTDPEDTGDGKPGENGSEPKNQVSEKSGKALKDGKKVSYKAKALANPRNALSTATGVVMPHHTSPDIMPTFNNVSSLIDRVRTVPLVGGESYQRPFVKSYGDGAGSTTENTDYNTSEPTFGYADIVREKITAYAEEPEEMSKLPDADYDGVVEESVTRAIRRYASRQILVGAGGTGKFRGIFYNPTSSADDIIDRNTDISTITAIDDGTLDEIIYSYGGDEDVEDMAVLILSKKDLKKFAKLTVDDPVPPLPYIVYLLSHETGRGADGLNNLKAQDIDFELYTAEDNQERKDLAAAFEAEVVPDVEYDMYLAPIPDEECYQTAYEIKGLLTKTKGVNRV